MASVVGLDTLTVNNCVHTHTYRIFLESQQMETPCSERLNPPSKTNNREGWGFPKSKFGHKKSKKGGGGQTGKPWRTAPCLLSAARSGEYHGCGCGPPVLSQTHLGPWPFLHPWVRIRSTMEDLEELESWRAGEQAVLGKLFKCGKEQSRETKWSLKTNMDSYHAEGREGTAEVTWSPDEALWQKTSQGFPGAPGRCSWELLLHSCPLCLPLQVPLPPTAVGSLPTLLLPSLLA